MLLKGEQLAAHLERELRPLYVLYGDEPLLVLEAADAIRAKSRQQGYSEREVLTVLTGFDWGQLLAAGGNMSLFGDRKLIDLRIPTGKPGKEGGAALQQWCGNLSADNLLLITLPELDWREEKAAWFTALVNAGVAIKLTTPPLEQLPGWLAMRLKRQKQSADREALGFIAERVEGNLLAAHQEIQKLGLLYPEGALTLEQVRDAVLNVARYDLDSLREALLAGDIGRYNRVLEGLQQEGEALPLVLWAVTEEVRALAAISEGLRHGQSQDALFREWKVWGPRQATVRHALQRLGASRSELLRQALAGAAEVDRTIKGLRADDPWLLLRRLGLLLSAPKPAARAAGRR
jgi:DNA polymerase-3 subunit delta